MVPRSRSKAIRPTASACAGTPRVPAQERINEHRGGRAFLVIPGKIGPVDDLKPEATGLLKVRNPRQQVLHGRHVPPATPAGLDASGVELRVDLAPQLPLVAIRPETERGCTEVFIYTFDQDGLFTWSSALLDQLGLKIMDARILTTDNHKALNLYLVALRTRHARGDLDTAELHAAEQRLRAWLAGRDEPGLARFAAAWDLVDGCVPAAGSGPPRGSSRHTSTR